MDPTPRALQRTAVTSTDGIICAPRTVADVVAHVNWAHRNGWQIRTTGVRDSIPSLAHNSDPMRTLLLDLSRHMNLARIDGAQKDAASANSDTLASVTALTGITIESLLTRLEQAGYGVTACPAVGEMTLGEALAIGAHGTAIPAGGETRVPGRTYGSLSNLIVSLTVVVWDATQQAYVARTVRRTDPRISALLVHLGRALVVAATLRVAPLQRLRCVSRTDLSAATVFAPPATAGPHSFAAQLKRFGRIESLWFPFTPAPWLKTWSVTPDRPSTSREAASPYNYPFTSEIGDEQSALLKELAEGNTWVTPLFTGLSYANVVAGLLATASVDLWGPAKNTQLHSRPAALSAASNGYVVLTTRERVQHVVSTFYDYLSSTLERYRAEGRFPVSGPWEVRVTGLDDPADCGVTDARPAQLSATATRPHADRAPNFDTAEFNAANTAVWLRVSTLTRNADSQRFYAELDAWTRATFTDPHETVRPDWTNDDDVPDGDDDDAWSAALTTASTTFNRLDPHRVYAGSFR